MHSICRMKYITFNICYEKCWETDVLIWEMSTRKQKSFGGKFWTVVPGSPNFIANFYKYICCICFRKLWGVQFFWFAFDSNLFNYPFTKLMGMALLWLRSVWGLPIIKNDKYVGKYSWKYFNEFHFLKEMVLTLIIIINQDTIWNGRQLSLDEISI